MYDYSLLGGFVETPGGIGRYLEHVGDKVLVVFDYGCPPVEYDAADVFPIGGQAYDIRASNVNPQR